jgi:carbon-monoxide dehydrogenase medium subunit
MLSRTKQGPDLHRPESLEAATDLLREGDAVLISGGQSLIPQLRAGELDYDAVVDLSGIDGHDRIDHDDGLRIGGLVTYQEVIESDLEKTPFRVLSETAEGIADRQVRNWGTVGGAVATGNPAMDYPPTLTVLDALVEHSDGRETARTPISEFYLDTSVTALADDEIVTGVQVPPLPEMTGVSFEKTARREGWALVNVAARVTVDASGTEIREARLCVGAMTPTPLRLRELEADLEGADPHDADHRRAVTDRLADYTDPVSQQHASAEYKNRVGANLLRKTVREATERATGGGR